MAATPISKKRKFVADGVFYAELNELLMRELVRSRGALRLTPPAASRAALACALRSHSAADILRALAG